MRCLIEWELLVKTTRFGQGTLNFVMYVTKSYSNLSSPGDGVEGSTLPLTYVLESSSLQLCAVQKGEGWGLGGKVKSCVMRLLVAGCRGKTQAPETRMSRILRGVVEGGR